MMTFRFRKAPMGSGREHASSRKVILAFAQLRVGRYRHVCFRNTSPT